MSASGDYVAPSGASESRRRKPAVRRLLSGAAGLIWPQRSLISGREVAGPGAIEPELWAKLRFLSAPLCVRCGAPFDLPAGAVDGEAQVCGACLARPPAYDRARAAVYGEVSRDLVLALKRQGRCDGLAMMARWMLQAGGPLVAEADLLVPAPLHYIRLARRGFNQSVWLCAGLGRLGGARVGVDVLKRVRRTPSQAGLSPDGRRRNVQGAFRVRRKASVSGRRVLLVDDVFTTGATVEACARELKKAGAVCVDVLTLARVAGPRSIPI
ncbi:MAG: ComF family protein [Alphaproteobacteria bacterium]|nr:ComF family protein [Alphaproteobacteria bacterium]